MNETIWHKDGKFLGWPKGVPHSPARRSVWGDLSSVKNRKKFKSYLACLRDFSPFVDDFNGLVFWRGLSRKVKKAIIAKAIGSDPIGFRLLMALNKRMTSCRNKRLPFVFADEVRRIKQGLKSKSALVAVPVVVEPNFPSPTKPAEPRSRGIPWSDPPSGEMLQRQAKEEQRRRTLLKYI